jgi:hypothetical protein
MPQSPGAIIGLPWGRFETLLGAKIIEADPRAAEEQAKIWEAERFVRSGRTNAVWPEVVDREGQRWRCHLLLATVNRIAEILKLKAIWSRWMSADQRPSASLLNRRWRCSCCGNSATSSVRP